jgi:hypothetical protein
MPWNRHPSILLSSSASSQDRSEGSCRLAVGGSQLLAHLSQFLPSFSILCFLSSDFEGVT